MKKFFLLAAAMLLTIAASAEVIPANDSRVTYVGRTLVEGTDVSFDWTATYFRIAFSGKSLTMKASETKWDADADKAATRHNYYNVWIDSPTSAEPHRIIEVAGNDTVIELIDPTYLKKSRRAVHEVIVQKRTEGEQGKMTIHEFATDAKGTFYQAESIRQRQLEFIGASYDCGYGVDDTSRLAKFSPETENASRSFCAIISRYFDADYVVVAHSGMGAARNYNSKFAGYHMPDRYLQTFDMDSTAATRWNAAESDIRPALT